MRKSKSFNVNASLNLKQIALVNCVKLCSLVWFHFSISTCKIVCMALCQTSCVSILVMITIVLAIKEQERERERRKKFNRKRNGITHIRWLLFFPNPPKNLPFISLLARLFFWFFFLLLSLNFVRYSHSSWCDFSLTNAICYFLNRSVGCMI